MDATRGQGETSSQTFVNENGYKIFCKCWSKDVTNPKAIVFIVHGFAEHCLYYDVVADVLKEKNVHVFSHDHQGHGQSEGPRAMINDFRHFSRDLFQHVEMRKKEFPNLPVYLVGHSMGGGVCLIAELDRPGYFAGIVLIGSLVIPELEGVGPVTEFLGKLIVRIFPGFPVIPLADEDKTRDKAMIEKIKADPAVYHGRVKAKIALVIKHALEEIESKLSDFKVPLLVLHGSQDKLVNPKGSEKLYKEASSQDKTLKIFPDAYHQLHTDIEPVCSEAIKDIVDWIDQHVPKA